MKRRDFLKTGLKIGVAANVLPVMLGGMPVRALGRSPLRRALETSGGGNNNVLVIIQLQGGNDGLNCVVPYADPLYKSLRPTLGLDKTADNLLVLSNHDSLAFHGSMTGISTLYGEGKVALLQNVGYPVPSLSHFRGTDVWNTGTDSSIYASTGWVGRLLYEQNPTYPPQTIPAGSQPLAVQFGNALSNIFLSANGGMGIAINKVPTDSSGSVHNYDAIPSPHSTQYDELEYIRIIQSETEVYAQTIVNRSVTTNKVTYPTSTLATQLSSIAQLIASGFQTKIYLVTQGSYDTHSNELNTQSQLLGDLSAAVLAFQQDLEAFGVADQVAMMTYSEFGRRPAENGSGTDHGTAAPLFVVGTKVIGMVYGNDSNLNSNALVAGNLAYDSNHDFRNIYATVMNEWLLAGGDQAQIDADIKSVLTSDANGTYSSTSNWNASLGIFRGSQSSVQSDSGAMGLMLMQNYPNPAAGTTTIEYALPAKGPVQLSLYNTTGVEVERIVDGNQDAGPHRSFFDTSRLPSGAYLYRLTTATGNVSRQMVIER